MAEKSLDATTLRPNQNIQTEGAALICRRGSVGGIGRHFLYTNRLTLRSRVQTQSGPKPAFEAKSQPDHHGNLMTPTMNATETTIPKTIPMISPRFGGNQGHFIARTPALSDALPFNAQRSSSDTTKLRLPGCAAICDMTRWHARTNKRSDLVTLSHARLHSITSSAVASSVGGIVRPSAFPAFRLITRSNLVGCWTGRSPGRSPFKIRPV